MTQLTFNNKTSNTIKMISFFINYGRNFNFFDYKESSMLTNATKLRVETSRKMHDNILKMQN